MNEKAANAIHWSFWAIAVFALVWNVLGSVNYMMQTNLDMVASLPDTHRAIIEGRPAWATGGFAISVFIGALGGLLLLLRKPVAFYLFVASLLGTAITVIHTIDVANSVIRFSVAEIAIMILSPVVVAAFMVWYSRRAQSIGWTR